MGFEPTIFPVTGGRVNQTTPRAHLIVVLRQTHDTSPRQLTLSERSESKCASGRSRTSV